MAQQDDFVSLDEVRGRWRRSQGMAFLRRTIVVVGAASLLGLVPLFVSGYETVFLLQVFMYIGLAYSWNLISGYTGYLSFGHVAFFGLGAYTAGLMSSAHGLGLPWQLSVPVAGVGAAILAIPLGKIMLRLKGTYFAIGMLAVAQLAALLASGWTSVTRGGRGIVVGTGYTVPQVYYWMLAIAAVLVLLTYQIDNSRLGLRLLAIREDEVAAEVAGIDTNRTKLAAFVASAFFPAMLGALYASYIGFIDPASVFALNFSIIMILMVVLGGMGTASGPLIGAAIYSVVTELLWARYPSYHVLLSGIALVLIVLFAPRGLVNIFQGWGLPIGARRFATRLVDSTRVPTGPVGRTMPSPASAEPEVDDAAR